MTKGTPRNSMAVFGPSVDGDDASIVTPKPNLKTSREPVEAETTSSDNPAKEFFDHSTAQRVNTDAVIVRAVRKEYPKLHLTVVPQNNCNLITYASAGHAGLAPIDPPQERLGWRFYVPPTARGGSGALGDNTKFAKYLLDWRGKEYIIYVVEGRDGTYPSRIVNQYVCSPSVDATNRLLLEAGAWNNELHGEVWLFDGGWWQKSAELYDSVQSASWDDVILDEQMKESLQNEVNTFFDSKELYEKYRAPWKRGLIYYGPPGNGKSISIKATMNQLYRRKSPIPTLYVRTLVSAMGPEFSINQIFSLARRTAPCFLVFEDLDATITPDVRSVFLNAVDGIQKNDGILMVGSTNHLELLDPGISKRPSRFDRKYLFPDPNERERTMYMQFWQKKLAGTKDLEFPDEICGAAAKITDGFSFAYMQEAMIASLLALARSPQDQIRDQACLGCLQEHENKGLQYRCVLGQGTTGLELQHWLCFSKEVTLKDDLSRFVLWREIRRQVRHLREQVEGKR